MIDEHNCRQMLGSLSEYVNGDLEKELCAEIERHMSGCENCQIVVNTLRKTVELYHVTAPAPDMPDEVRSRLFRRLNLDEFLNK